MAELIEFVGWIISCWKKTEGKELLNEELLPCFWKAAEPHNEEAASLLLCSCRCRLNTLVRGWGLTAEPTNSQLLDLEQ